MDTKIISTMAELRNNHGDLFTYQGLGYCGYMSSLLLDVLKSKYPTAILLLGRQLANSKEAEMARKETIKIIETFPIVDDGSPYYQVRKSFVERGHRLPKITGHAVVLINNEIYDITSGQFNLPEYYQLPLFTAIWEKLFEGTIVRGPLDKDFGIDRLDRKPFKKPKTMIESW